MALTETAPFQPNPRVGIVMGSDSDLEFMIAAAHVFEKLEFPYEYGFTSAHRTPDLMDEYATEAAGRGLLAIIAGAGGSAHLPGMLASKTELPVKAVAIGRTENEKLAAIGSMIYMPKGVDLDFMGVNDVGAHNAALSVIRMACLHDDDLDGRYLEMRSGMGRTVRNKNRLVNRIGGIDYLEAMKDKHIEELLRVQDGQ